MISYRDYDNDASGFEKRSPRGSSYRQNLGFLDEFKDGFDDNQIEKKHSVDNQLYRRGCTYTVLISVAWVLVCRQWPNSHIGTFVLFFVAFSFADVRSALRAVWWPTDSSTPMALERRSSSVPANFTPSRRRSMHRRTRNVAHRATYSGPEDPFSGLHPDNQPHRLWHESLNDAWPHIRDDSIAGLKNMPFFLWHMFWAHVYFQFLVTLMQTLGVHFREGHDATGLFPRVHANLISTKNLFGIGGFVGLIRGLPSVARWWWNVIFVGASKLLAFLMRGLIVPGVDWTDEKLSNNGTAFRHEPGSSSTGVHQ